MHKLKLDLIIRKPGLTIQTAIRVFDEKSLKCADLLVRSGGLGMHSKLQYRVTGLCYDPSDWPEVAAIDLPFYWKNKGNGEWIVNPELQLLVLTVDAATKQLNNK
jgi:hypothetical protein